MIDSRKVTQATLVWSEGMSSWQRAGDVPGLLSGRSRPPTFRPSSFRPSSLVQANGGGPLTAEFGVWSLLGRALVFFIGMLLVIPAPWAATSFYRWLIPCLHVPQRSSLEFTGRPGDIWYVFVILGLFNYAGVTHVPYLTYILLPLQAYLSWMTVRWIVANISSEERQLPLAFEGAAFTYIGWYVLLLVSAITIIGWAWVTTAWMRWICRNIAGTRREIVFNASGWQVLWRTLAFSLCSILIIPIPWILRWYANWYVSQFAVVEASA